MNDLKPWHKAVCERDNYVCQECFKSFSRPCYFDENGLNQYVCGHHVETRGAHPEKTFNVDNGICVCRDCHDNLHNNGA